MELSEANKIIQELKSIHRKFDGQKDENNNIVTPGIFDKLEKIYANLIEKEKQIDLDRSGLHLEHSKIYKESLDLKVIIKEIKELDSNAVANYELNKEKLDKLIVTTLEKLDEISVNTKNIVANIDVSSAKKDLEKILEIFLSEKTKSLKKIFEKNYDEKFEIIENHTQKIDDYLTGAIKATGDIEIYKNEITEISKVVSKKFKLLNVFGILSFIIFGIFIGFFGKIGFDNYVDKSIPIVGTIDEFANKYNLDLNYSLDLQQRPIVFLNKEKVSHIDTQNGVIIFKK
jgi:hypothetical protein